MGNEGALICSMMWNALKVLVLASIAAESEQKNSLERINGLLRSSKNSNDQR
jgi:hypothetical protein